MHHALKVNRPVTAFSLSSTARKRPRAEDRDHLAFVRGLPCLCCGTHRTVEAAHVRYGDRRYGKRETGMAERPDDRWAVPLCTDHHRAQHAFGDERAWWAGKTIDPLRVAAALFGATGDDEAGALIVASAKETARG